ncbi:class I SAM-dependent methyltransferase [Bailinhaonella thermotolerans]|uniref:Class I SAM-dependent methyltransferase n=1 Tax=Bailinhaonella thermotolerans TaxID=1070861 RepID=A0A3A4B5H7_9ACTN|nr:class I SAM-dependent methyltransferase [Bailinhaonella thermotolerans]RJL35880.1 class I SAM-dependent methyltransferase [Bailinhaonella thermotolerans]
MTPRRRPADRRLYTRARLSWYDTVVLGLVCPLVWRCPRREMVALYDRNAGARHLDLGPGTGFFLDRCAFPAPDPRITIVDLGEDVLRKVSRRLARHRPVAHRADVLAPLPFRAERFDSVGMNFLLHCLPGGMSAKAVVFDHVLPYVAPGGRVFGSTVLADGVEHGRHAARALAHLNAEGVLSNAGDSFAGLEAELARRFPDHRLTARGSVGLFEAVAPGEGAR